MGNGRMKEGLDWERREAARMLADGMSAAEAAERLGRHENTIYRWMKRAEVRRAYREAVMRRAAVSYARAVKRLSAQVDDENAQVAQRAAKEVMERFGDALMKESDGEIVVRVEGAPELGMPEEAREDDGIHDHI